MGEQSPRQYEEAEIDLRIYFSILRKVWWKVALLSLAVGVATLLYLFTKPNIYQATAVITPSVDEKKQNPALGALASFGVSIGGPSSVEDLESLFKSDDPTTGGIKISVRDSLFGQAKKQKPLGDWDAIRAVKGALMVSVNKRAGTVSLYFYSPSAEGSANIVRYYLDEGKNRLQEESLDRAIKNKKFIEEQIGRTIDALTRDRLYFLYGQEVEREMMARNREQFGFRIVDSPRVPDRKVKPKRGQSAMMATVLSFFVGCGFFIVRGKNRKKEYSLTNTETRGKAC